jgi:DNA-binding NarL/FixJ family response regulator
MLQGIPEFLIVAEVRNGQEVLEAARKMEFDLILMDIEMPGCNGIEATRMLLEEQPEAKVLALTMFNEKGIIVKVMEAGAKGYVLKNAHFQELVEAIKKVASGQNFISSDVIATLMERDSVRVESSQAESETGSLTKRELEILKLIAQGFSNKEIGEKLFISHRTVDTHRTHLLDKLQVKNIAGLIRFAMKNGYLD